MHNKENEEKKNKGRVIPKCLLRVKVNDLVHAWTASKRLIMAPSYNLLIPVRIASSYSPFLENEGFWGKHLIWCHALKDNTFSQSDTTKISIIQFWSEEWQMQLISSGKNPFIHLCLWLIVVITCLCPNSCYCCRDTVFVGQWSLLPCFPNPWKPQHPLKW